MDALALANVLCDCARRGFLQRSALLLSCGADVNAADYDRRTALHVGEQRCRPCACGSRGPPPPPALAAHTRPGASLRWGSDGKRIA
eukprot:5332181-Pleurochrysis_carterae.AAC.1